MRASSRRLRMVSTYSKTLWYFCVPTTTSRLGTALNKLVAARLGHAAHETIDHVFAVAPGVHHGAHFPERLLLGLVAHRAGVDEDGVGLVFVGGDRVAALAEHARDLFGVALVHLASVGLDVNFGHGISGSGAQARRENPEVQGLRCRNFSPEFHRQDTLLSPYLPSSPPPRTTSS